jgi:hypothetical protein
MTGSAPASDDDFTVTARVAAQEIQSEVPTVE